jgi:hypothetical protein
MFSRAERTRTPFFLSLALYVAAVIAVASEAVKLVNKNTLKGFLRAILNHLLKFGPPVCCTRDRAVYVLTQYPIAIALGKGIAFFELGR